MKAEIKYHLDFDGGIFYVGISYEAPFSKSGNCNRKTQPEISQQHLTAQALSVEVR